MAPKWHRDPYTQRDYYVDDKGVPHWRPPQGQPSSSGQDPRSVSGAFTHQVSTVGRQQPSAVQAPEQQSPISANASSWIHAAPTQPLYDGTGPSTATSAYKPGHQIASTSLSQSFQRMSIQPCIPQGQSSDTQKQIQHIPQAIVPRTWQDGGIDFMDILDNTNHIRTIVQTGPPSSITPKFLSQEGILSHMNLLGTDGDAEQLFETFRKRRQPRKFFTVGKVFRVLWSEPARDDATHVSAIERGTSFARSGEAVFSKVRRFVVIREGDTFCGAIPITTYGGRGLAKPGTIKSEHGIIYTGKIAPEPVSTEAPIRGEKPMRPDPIRVNADSPTDKLDGLSRVNYGKVFTIEHNVKVQPFGDVHSRSMNAFLHQFRNVWVDSGSSTTISSGKVGPSTSSTGVRTRGTVTASSATIWSAGRQSSSSVGYQRPSGQVPMGGNGSPQRGSPSQNEFLVQQAETIAQQMPLDGWSPEQVSEYVRERHHQSIRGIRTQRSGTKASLSSSLQAAQSPMNTAQLGLNVQSQLSNNSPSQATSDFGEGAYHPKDYGTGSFDTLSDSQTAVGRQDIIGFDPLTFEFNKLPVKFDSILEAYDNDDMNVRSRHSVSRRAWAESRDNMLELCRNFRASSWSAVGTTLEQSLQLETMDRMIKALNDHLDEVLKIFQNHRKPFEEDSTYVSEELLNSSNAHRVEEIQLRFQCISERSVDLSAALELYKDCNALGSFSHKIRAGSDVEQLHTSGKVRAHLQAIHSGMDQSQLESVLRHSHATASEFWFLCPLCDMTIQFPNSHQTPQSPAQLPAKRAPSQTPQNLASIHRPPAYSQSQVQPQPQPQSDSTRSRPQPLTQSQNRVQEACVEILTRNGYSGQQASDYVWAYVHRCMQEHNYSRDQALAALKSHLNRNQRS